MITAAILLCMMICDENDIPYKRYIDIIMDAMALQITGVSGFCSGFCSGADQRKHQSSASQAFVKGIHRWPVTGGFPSQRASNAENASIWWRHHEHTRLSPRHNTSMASDNLMYYFLAMPVWYITLTNISQWWIPDYIHWNLIALLILPIIHRKDNLSF